MDHPALHRPLAPTERGLTFRTPHLVASVGLGNAHPATGARPGVLAQFLYGVHVFLFTYVVVFFTGDGEKTFGARVF